MKDAKYCIRVGEKLTVGENNFIQNISLTLCTAGTKRIARGATSFQKLWSATIGGLVRNDWFSERIAPMSESFLSYGTIPSEATYR
jgi:hypothetical protein